MTNSYLEFPVIDPVIVSLGPLALRWYGLMYLLGFVAAMWLANRAADNSKGLWSRDQVSDLLFYGFLGVILGGRLGYVFFYQFELFVAEPLYLFKIWEGGMSFHGGLLGVLTAIWLFARKENKTFLAVGDFVAPLVPIGLGLGRLGNFINAELWGRTTDVPWAFVFPGAGHLPRHPSQLYEFFLEGVVLFAVVYYVARQRRPIGFVSGIFLIGYGCFRSFVEFFREPDAHLGFIFSFVSMGQLLSLPMVVLGVYLLFNAYEKNQFAEPQQKKVKKGASVN
jgi:phosphatidylglycerol:prolipoprotein diacylglycerol transferase